MNTALYLGLMSGTSMDGVDAAVCEFRDQRLVRLRGTHTLPYPAPLRERLLQLVNQPTAPLADLCALDAQIADVFAQAALATLEKSGCSAAQIHAIGSHGQTVFHTPPVTLQLGDPNRIAAQTGITTVADFRRRDLALGGQGAPLVPAFHQAQFAVADEARAVVNIGGIANLTYLPGSDEGVLGFDTGPGNGLMDEWTAEKLHQLYDENGAWAQSGQIHDELLAALLAQPYFARRPPKSTGRGDFNLMQCRALFPTLDALKPVDVQRSFCELTARSIADAVTQHAPRAQRVLLCGGGVRNNFLVQRMTALLPRQILEPTDAYGLDAQWVEAAAFAWLAMRTLSGLPGNLPAVTGASAPAILGGIYAGKRLPA